MKKQYARAVQQNPSGMKCTHQPIKDDQSLNCEVEDIRVKELKSLESVGADRGFIPPFVRYRNILNFGVGLILGCISFPMWYYSKFLYYTFFCVQVVILFILFCLESVGADRGFIPPSVRYRNILNFGVGLILGCILFPMWYYSKFLYYTVFCVQVVILFILINGGDGVSSSHQ